MRTNTACANVLIGHRGRGEKGTLEAPHRYAVLVGVLILTSCGGSACPLDEVINIPILTVQDATDASTGERIPQLVLSDISIQGQPQSGGAMQLLVSTDSRNTTIEGNQLRCTIACAFSHTNGDYVFTVSAPGYVSKTVTVPSVRYTEFQHNGCTNTATRGTSLAIVMDPAP